MAFLESENLLVFEEQEKTELIIYKQIYRGNDYYILGQIPPYFMSIVADKTANTNSGKLYIASSDGFYIIDLNKKEVVDVITKTHSKVSVKDKLKQEDIVDLNIGGNPSLA